MRAGCSGPAGKKCGENAAEREKRKTSPSTPGRIVVETQQGLVNGQIMFRLMALLCVGIYVAMLIFGQDRGQLRFGLMQAEAVKSAAQPVVANATVLQPSDAAGQATVVSFVPEQPLMATPANVEAPAEPVALAAPEAAQEGRLFYVAAESVNVRAGPGKAHAVIDSLPRGEAVLVLVEGEGPESWSLIRIEGDGVEGYVASRLLTE